VKNKRTEIDLCHFQVKVLEKQQETIHLDLLVNITMKMVNLQV